MGQKSLFQKIVFFWWGSEILNWPHMTAHKNGGEIGQDYTISLTNLLWDGTLLSTNFL